MFETFWDDEVGTLTFQLHEGAIFAHATAKQWNKSVYQKFQDIWYVAKEELLNSGFKEVYVVIPSGDKKLFKFETMFGFKPVKEVDNMLLMVCSTEKQDGN